MTEYTLKNRQFKPEDHREIKLWKTLKEIGKDVLLHAVAASCVHTTEYIIANCLNDNHPRKSRRIYRREKEKAREKSGSNYDITFLTELLVREVYPVGNKSAMECYRAIKDLRNELTHGIDSMSLQVFNAEMDSLQLLLSKTIIQTLNLSMLMQSSETLSESESIECKMGCKTLHEIKTSLFTDVKMIKNTVLNVLDVDEYLLEEAQTEILKGCHNQFFLNPVEVFIGIDLQIPLAKVFTDFTVRDSLKNLEDQNDSLSVNYIIQLLKRPLSKQLIIIEGRSGIGKSTLIKYILFLKNENLDAVDGFILKLDCCQKICSNLKEFVISVLPKSKRVFGEQKIYDSIMSTTPLFLIDGLDEISPQSKYILSEIMHIVDMKAGIAFCTSRAEGIEEFLFRYMPKFYYCFSLQGVKPSDREDFVKKWYDEFHAHSLRQNKNKRITSLNEIYNTMDNLSEILDSHFEFPMILTLFIYLCVFSPGSIDNFRSVGMFYNEIVVALQGKLITRISSKRESSSLAAAAQKVKCFFEYICQVLFAMLGNITLEVNDQMVVQLQGKCAELDIEFEDSCSTFFESKIIYTPTGIEKTYTFPTEAYKQFLAAVFLKAELSKKNVSIFKVLPVEHIKSLTRYSHTIMYTAGLLSNNITKKQCKQIVYILLVAANYFGPEMWIKLLREANCNAMIAYYVSKNIRLIKVETDELHICTSILQFECPNLSLVLIEMFQGMITPKTPYELNKVNQYMKGKSVAYTIKFMDLHIQDKIFSYDDYIIAPANGVRCTLDSFQGCLGVSGIKALPQRLNNLYLHVSLPEHCAGLVELSKKYVNLKGTFSQKNYQNIGELHVSLPRSVGDSSQFLPLPIAELSNGLHISDICDDDLGWTVDILKKLQPVFSKPDVKPRPKGFTFVAFKQTTLHLAAIKLLVDMLSENDICIQRNLMVFSRVVTSEDVDSSLKSYCKTKLGCNLLIFESRVP